MRSYRKREMSNDLPIPQPRPLPYLGFLYSPRPSTKRTDSVFKTLPRAARWLDDSGPDLAWRCHRGVTFNDENLRAGSTAWRQSLSFPGSIARDVLVLRETDSEAAREAARAREAAMIRAITASATVRLLLSHCSRVARIAPSTEVCVSGLLSRSLV